MGMVNTILGRPVCATSHRRAARPPWRAVSSYPAAFSAGAGTSRTTSPWQIVRLRPACLAAYSALSAHAMMSCLVLPSSGYTDTPSDSVALRD